MGSGKVFPLCWLSFLLCSFPGQAGPVEHSASRSDSIRLTITDVDYSTGVVQFEIVTGICSSGQILQATTALGTLDFVLVSVEQPKAVALARDPDLLALYQSGDVLEGWLLEPEALSRPSPEVSDLLDQLESFGERLGGLIDESTEEQLLELRSAAEWRRDRWRGDVGIRIGYARFVRSGAVITDLDPNDRASVERGLADLEELILRAREVPGIDQSDLDRAEDLAADARAILDDPAGDLEEAVANIVACQIIVEVAVERAGQDPDTVRVRDFEEEREDTVEEHLFVNLRREFPWGETGELYIDEHLEGGRRFFSEDLRLRAERDLTPRLRMRFESDTGVRFYRKDFADDVFAQGADLEMEAAITRSLDLALGGEYLYRREFNTSSDDGFQFGAPRLIAGYRFGRWGRLEANYERGWRKYNSSTNSDLDYRQDVAGLSYSYFGPHGMLSFLWEHTDRDADRPLDEDDYTEDEFSAYLSYGWTPELTLGMEGDVAEREYVTTGPSDPSTQTRRGEDNTDFDRWGLRPFLEIRWTRYLSTTLDYEYVRLENQDRVPEDDIDKSLGDYDLHRIGFGIQWNPADRWEVFLRHDVETRNYSNGETGRFETWFADFRNLADYDSLNLSALVVCHLTASLDAELELFHTRERYPTFDELDSNQSSIQFILRYLF